MRQALSDLRVVELGTGVAAGWCGKVFADLGADVVKVEPPDGDPLRADAGMFTHLHTNKRSAVVEVASSNSAASLSTLLDGVDVVIDAPGVRSLADWSIDRDELLARRRTLTVVAITGFGSTGPYADYAWSDLVAQALSGAIVSTGAARSSCRCRSARPRSVTPPRSARSRACSARVRPASARSWTVRPSRRSRPLRTGSRAISGGSTRAASRRS
ncbi:MAG: CoA transferase [Acidimicrobiia bacterium]